MTTDPDDIIERLTKRREFQINLGDVFNANDLENAIKKSFDDDSRRNTLERNKGILFDTAKTKDSVVDNSIQLIEDAKSLDELKDTSEGITANIGKIGKQNEEKIQSAEAVREKELFKEKTPEEITRQEIIDSPRRRITKFSKDFGITEEEAREVVVDKGFELSEDEKTFKIIK